MGSGYPIHPLNLPYRFNVTKTPLFSSYLEASSSLNVFPVK